MTPKRLPSGLWRIQVRHGTKRRSGTARTRREAIDLGSELLLEMRGLGQIGKRPTVRGLVDRRIITADHWAAKTRVNYELASRRIPARLAATVADQVSVANVEDAYAQLLADGITANAVRHVHGLLSQAFNEGLRLGVVKASPMLAVKRPPTSTKPITPPDPATVTKILAAADPTVALALRLSATTGARAGEVVAIRWDSLDLDAPSDHLAITESLSTAGGKMRTRGTKTGAAGHRRIALDAETIRLLRRHRSEQMAEALELAFDRPVYVFSHDLGTTPWRPDYLSHQFAKARTAAGHGRLSDAQVDAGDAQRPIPRLHDLRHFAATQQLAAGVPLRVVSKRLGHTDTRTTERVYGHWLPGEDSGVADLMGGLLDGAG